MTEKDYRFTRPTANINNQGILASTALQAEGNAEREEQEALEATGSTLSPELFTEIDIALSVAGLTLSHLLEVNQSQLAPYYEALNTTGKDWKARKPILAQIVALVESSVD